MGNEMHCVTVSEWKSVHKRLDDLENIVKDLKSKSILFGNENQNINWNLGTQNFVEMEGVEFNTQPNLISANNPDSDPPTTGQMVQETLTLTSELNISEVSTSSHNLADANAGTSVIMTEKVIHPRTPSASSSSSCLPKGIGIQDQNAFEKIHRAVISLKRCDETEVLAGKTPLGSKNKQSKIKTSTANKARRTRPANAPRKPTGSVSKGNGNGKPSETSVGENQRRYKCLICTRKFTRKYGLSKHSRVHTGEKPYTCHVCAKVFSCKGGLNVHLRLHTGERPFTCSLCPKTFNQRSQLKSHLRVHTGEKPYQCRFCSKSFSHQQVLTSHILVHTGEKPYSCQYCPKMCRNRGDLNSHMKTHTREKPFVCRFCKRSFSFPVSLRRHLTCRHSAGK